MGLAFVELTGRSFFALTIFTQFNSGKKIGIYYIDGGCLPVCHRYIGWEFRKKNEEIKNLRAELNPEKPKASNQRFF